MPAKNILETHQYVRERVTPIGEIPAQYQVTIPFPGGRTQIVDTRLCYNWEPGENGGRLVECGSVAANAEQAFKEHG